MARFLLDADAVVDYLIGWRPTVALVDDLFREGHVIAVCDVVVAEIYAGLSTDAALRDESFVASLDCLSTSWAAAKQAGSWRYAYARQGFRLPATDALIAATAVEHNATLVTGNHRHYPMDGLSLLPLPR
jgi:predicted nucleic acid-binding protein